MEATAVISETFWAELDARIALNRPAPATAEHPPLTSGGGATIDVGKTMGSASDTAANWTGVPDAISSATDAPHSLEMGLHGRFIAKEVLIADLQLARQEVLTLSTLLQKTQAQAETVMRAIEARADARIRETEDRARAAELRADLAEDWLRRIEQASRNLLPDHQCVAA